jgi:ABC-2 type transport system permease protein
VIVAARMLRDRRRSSLSWALGLLSLVAFTVALYPTIKDQESFDTVMRDLPESVKVLVGYDAAVPVTSPAGYLHGRLFALLAPIVVIVFAVGAGSEAIGGSEEAGTLEPLLANPVTRTRVLVERYAVVVGLLTGLVAMFAASILALGTPTGAVKGVALTRVLGACAAMLALALLHGTVAFAVGAAVGRRGPAVATATVLAIAGYLLQSLVAASPSVRVLRFFTPWHPYLDRNVLAYGVSWPAVVVPAALSIVLVLAGHAVFVRRDLR